MDFSNVVPACGGWGINVCENSRHVDGFYLAWAFVTYIVWGTLYSTVNIPYGSMASVITNDPVERTILSTWRTAGSMCASYSLSYWTVNCIC